MNDPINKNRRKMLMVGAAASSLGIIGAAYSLKRGIRYPTLGLEPKPLPTQFLSSNNQTKLTSNDLIRLTDRPDTSFALRAFSPEPSITIENREKTRLFLSINNVPLDAELTSNNSVRSIKETRNGINREIEIDLNTNESVNLQWRLPFSNDFSFASIGDSGGDKELAWCIERAHQLGAKFFLHLGDFNYQAGDYKRSVELFRNSPIPCYISIGNHDFHENGSIYPQFLSELGPLNHAFTIGKTRFANLDTAANVFPYSSGKRGKLISKLIHENQLVADTVAYTHRPLHDPLEDSSHDIGSIGERDWLIDALNQINCNTLLSGHIHIYHRSNFKGIDNIIAGQGLGHQDLLTKSDYSKMVVGHVERNGRVSYTTAPLSMPFELHCHPRSQSARDTLLTTEPKGLGAEISKRIEATCQI